MTRSIAFPDALIVFGALIGGTPIGWWLGGIYGAMLGAQAAIVVGFAMEPNRRRFALALSITAAMWWPAWLGPWL